MSEYSVVLDTETLGRKPHAVITEVGIIAFRRADFEIVSELGFSLDIYQQLAAGRSFCPDTLKFHRDKGTLPESGRGKSPLVAVALLEEFIGEFNPKRVWIQGTCFERPLIEDLCDHFRVELPWHFTKSRDCRSIFDVAFPDKRHDPRPHRALPDARATLKDLVDSLTVLNRVEAA